MSCGECLSGCVATYEAQVHALNMALLAALDQPMSNEARLALVAQHKADVEAARDALQDCIFGCFSTQEPPQGGGD